MFVVKVCIHSVKPKHGTVVWRDYFGLTGITSSKLDLFWPTNASSASGHRASRWAARATPIKKWALVSEAVRGSEPTCSCPGAAAVLMIRATLEAADVRGGQSRSHAAVTTGAVVQSDTLHPHELAPGRMLALRPAHRRRPAPGEPLCRCEEGQCRVSRDGVASLQRPGSVELGRPR